MAADASRESVIAPITSNQFDQANEILFLF
jgi:hypothetical protein